MGEIPEINVLKKERQLTSQPGMAGKVAIIGAFDSEISTPVSCPDLEIAYEQLGTNSDYNGCKCIPFLFNKNGGASSILAVNITTKTKTGTGDSATTTVDKTLTPAKLTTALSKIKGENFNILFIADTLTDEGLSILKEFLEESSEIQKPAGLILPLTRANKSEYNATLEQLGDYIYYINTQRFSVNNVDLDLITSTAHMCGLIAGANVSKTLTSKQIDDVTNLIDEYTFEDGDLGKDLVKMGIPVLKTIDRDNDKIICVNSELPNGYDIYINRTRDYVIRAFNLNDVLGEKLGEKRKEAPLNAIKSMLAGVKKNCVDTLQLLEDINYEVEKKSAKCVNVYIEDLVFASLITKINVYVGIEVV